MASIIFQLVLNGLIAGAIYALVASGFSLIYNVAKFIHFAHGSITAVGAYIFFFFAGALKLPLWISVILTLFFTPLAGLALDRTVYKMLRNRKASNAVLLIASLALLILLNNLLLAFFGADVKSIQITNPVFEVLGARITFLQILIIVSSLLLLFLLYLLMYKTKLGKAMRAVADNKEIAQTIGISPERIYAKTFLISSFLAGIAGILLGLEQNLHPEMGTSIMIKAFTGAVIGGMASVPGSILGSLFVGLVENIGIWWLPSGYKDAIAFTLLFIFLLFRPQGLMGGRQ